MVERAVNEKVQFSRYIKQLITTLQQRKALII